MVTAMLRIAPWWLQEIRGVRAIRWHRAGRLNVEAQADPARAGVVEIHRVSEFETGFCVVDVWARMTRATSVVLLQM
jgi:hypothetical protein